MIQLTEAEQQQICEILERRANEIANHLMDYTRETTHLGSIELALSREIDRLRRLAERLSQQQLRSSA